MVWFRWENYPDTCSLSVIGAFERVDGSYLTQKVTPGMRVIVTGVFDVFNQNARSNKVLCPTLNQTSQLGGEVALKSPYLHVLGLQVDPDANGSNARAFTSQQEEEFLAISKRPNYYEEFISSLAPQIYGSDGISGMITIRYQESYCVFIVWWLKNLFA